MISADLFNKIISLGVILSQVFIAYAIIHVLFFRKTQNALTIFLSNNGMLLAFLAALVSTCSSLFYSNVIGFPPCDLCWLQRIFMYPEVILLGLALIKKDSRIIDYALSVAFVGGIISVYHNYIYYFNQGLNASCQILGNVSCVKRYVFEFGYITIPIMALTGFALVITFLLFQKFGQKTSN